MSDDLITIEMTTEAAQELWKALVWASTRAEMGDRMDHYHWLSWAYGRIGYRLALMDKVPS